MTTTKSFNEMRATINELTAQIETALMEYEDSEEVEETGEADRLCGRLETMWAAVEAISDALVTEKRRFG